MLNFFLVLYSPNSPLPNALTSLSNALPCFPPTFARRTRGHSLRNFRAVNFCDSPRNSKEKCSASHLSLHHPLFPFCLSPRYVSSNYQILLCYRGADKSLARPGRKETTATRFLSFIYTIYNHNWRNISKGKGKDHPATGRGGTRSSG